MCRFRLICIQFFFFPWLFGLVTGGKEAQAGVWHAIESTCEAALTRAHWQGKSKAELKAYANGNIESLFADILPLRERNFLKEAFSLHIDSPLKSGKELAEALSYPGAKEHLRGLVPGVRQRAAQVMADGSADPANQSYIAFHVGWLKRWASKSEKLIENEKISFFDFMHHIYEYAGLVRWSYSRDFLEVQDLDHIQDRYFASTPLNESILNGQSVFQDFPYIAFLPTTSSLDFEDVTGVVGAGPWPLGLASANERLIFDGSVDLDAGNFFFHDIFHFSVTKDLSPSGRTQWFENLRLESQLTHHFEGARQWRNYHRAYFSWARSQPEAEWMLFAGFGLVREWGKSPSQLYWQAKEKIAVEPGVSLASLVPDKVQQNFIENIALDQSLKFDHENEISIKLEAALERFFGWLIDYSEQAQLP